MDQFIVEGNAHLSGEITPSGNKNEALPVLAAILLTEDPVILRNVPDIADIRDMRELLASLGVRITRLDEHTFQFESPTISSHEPSIEIASRIRGSFLLAGPMLARHGHIRLPSPGGDKIGFRPVSTHLLALRSLGAEIVSEKGMYQMSAHGLEAANIYLDEASVMGTENALMAAALAKGTTVIYNAACEPHVQGLCHCLNAMGAKISNIGSNMLIIEGCDRLHGCDYTIQPDHTEVGSFIGLAAVTRSELVIRNAGVQYLRMVRMGFEKLGVTTIAEGDNLRIPKDQELQIRTDPSQGITKIDDSPWPGFPADLVSIMTVVATQASGTVLIFEKMFESRLFWVDKLISMGATIILCDPHRAVVNGPAPLRGAALVSPDIRAGMALLIAALGADGQSVIQNIRQIDRGYERIDQRLNALGAQIQRVPPL